MKENKIIRVMALGFDPRETSEVVRYIFDDHWMAFFWLAIKQGHLVAQYFDFDCIRIGGAARRGFKTSEELLNVCTWGRDPIWRAVVYSQNEMEFRAQLWELAQLEEPFLWYWKGKVLRHKEHGLIKYTGDSQRRAGDPNGDKHPLFIKPDKYSSLVLIEDVENLSRAEDFEELDFEQMLCQNLKT